MSKKSKEVILSVTNDLSTDQRMHKVATTLIIAGFKPFLVGRKLKTSKILSKRDYQTKRFWLPFSKGVLFYAIYNIRLFFYLLTKKAIIFVSNDLDTLPASYFAYKIKKLFGNKSLKLVYDSHELFTAVPELNGRTLAKKTWLFFEKLILPKIKYAYTVCSSIANYYHEQYGIKMQIVYNYPICKENNWIKEQAPNYTFDNQKVILYQGALNIGRGIEHVINIMDRFADVIFVIAGRGDIESYLKSLVVKKKLNKKVLFTGAIPLEKLAALTTKADLGLVLQEDLSLSYRYVLPNRLFDFMKANTPILASDLPELRKIVIKEEIGLLIEGFDQEMLVNKIEKLLFDKEYRAQIKVNLKGCYQQYCWEKQEKKLIKFYQNLVQKN